MPKRLAYALLRLLGLAALVTPAAAAPVRYVLAPETVQLQFRAYGLGMLPIDGRFTRFTGTLALDTADPAACTLDLQAEAASLRMPSASMTEDALGPDLLDVGRFPEFRVRGTCRNGRLDATLTLHGVSRPIPMAVTVGPGTWTVSGTMRRADWGMGARPLLAGPDVRVSLVAGLPQTAK